MKNFLAYTNPAKKFNAENELLIKVHIDNSLELGWKREDILLYTNFDYEYNGVRATLVPDLHLDWDKTSNKILVIDYLLKNKLLPEGLYWYHDLDAYQNEPISEGELEMDGLDLGLTGYGYKSQVNGGSFFFKETAGDVFSYWAKRLQEIHRTRADEKTMTDMTRNGEMEQFKYKYLNITYNFGQRCPKLCYEMAHKPLKVLHFHPHYWYSDTTPENIDIFMNGNNRWKTPMMSDRLISIFKKHGV